MKPVIEPLDFLKLENSEDIIIIDVRVGANAKSSFENLHLKGALWVDAETELAQKSDNAANGGRHPLPPVDKFCVLLGNLGITPSSHVIIYDDKNGANAAARFWWMLKAVGHKKVQVIDGGLQAAIKNGFPTSSEPTDIKPQAVYPCDNWQLQTADINEVAQAALAPDHTVIDVRDSERYLGIHEPIDLIAGHIPGAVNIPFNENLDENGLFLPSEKLKEKYEQAIGNFKTGNIIVHCGSGITACHTLLAIAQADMPIPKLYVGSWSEWSRNDREIGKG
jgi:thiosulfate/3-mercaptopyruvate sulfurtransferase